jgi:hypothetical protein
MLSTIISLVASTIAVSFIVAYFILNKKLKDANFAIMKLYLASTSVQDLLDNPLISSEVADNDIHKENFIKFLSDSRDWAFEYIESAQSGIQDFCNEVGPLIEYFDKYGDTLSNTRPDYDSMKKISKAYKELVKLLPDSEK